MSTGWTSAHYHDRDYTGGFNEPPWQPSESRMNVPTGGQTRVVFVNATGTGMAEQWDEVLLSEIERQQKHAKDVVVRADSAFAKPELYEALEARGVRYAIRVPSNDILEREVAELLRRPVGRPSHRPLVRYTSFRYQAASWTVARRVVAKIEFHFGELFPRVGFIVTTLEMGGRAVVRFYNKRATAGSNGSRKASRRSR